MQTFHNQSQMIEANIHRFKEGARVLEDIARFVLEDLSLFEEIKHLKHQVALQTNPIQYARDIGGIAYLEETSRTSLLEVIQANAGRMQESARVLEELTDREKYKTIRFTAYTVHQSLLTKYLAKKRQSQLSGIYPICDPKRLSIEEMATVINRQNISLCQLRMPGCKARELYQAACLFKSKLNEDILFIINDHLDIALLCADGVHLGQGDLPLAPIRAYIGAHFIIGISCHTVSEANKAQSDGASYISVGCLFDSKTKQNTTATPLRVLQEIVSQCTIPVCAIGGINEENIAAVKACSVNMIALHDAFWC